MAWCWSPALLSGSATVLIADADGGLDAARRGQHGLRLAGLLELGRQRPHLGRLVRRLGVRRRQRRLGRSMVLMPLLAGLLEQHGGARVGFLAVIVPATGGSASAC